MKGWKLGENGWSEVLFYGLNRRGPIGYDPSPGESLQDRQMKAPRQGGRVWVPNARSAKSC
jgi:hypothetical protein